MNIFIQIDNKKLKEFIMKFIMKNEKIKEIDNDKSIRLAILKILILFSISGIICFLIFLMMKNSYYDFGDIWSLFSDIAELLPVFIVVLLLFILFFFFEILRYLIRLNEKINLIIKDITYRYIFTK